MSRRGIIVGFGLSLLGTLALIRPTPCESPLQTRGAVAPTSLRREPARCACLDAPSLPSRERTVPPQAPTVSGPPEESAWIFVHVIRPADCRENALFIAVESPGLIQEEVAAGFAAFDVPADRDYLVTAHAYESAGEGMIRHRLGRAMVSRVFGSAVVWVELNEEEVYEDRS